MWSITLGQEMWHRYYKLKWDVVDAISRMVGEGVEVELVGIRLWDSIKVDAKVVVCKDGIHTMWGVYLWQLLDVSTVIRILNIVEKVKGKIALGKIVRDDLSHDLIRDVLGGG